MMILHPWAGFPWWGGIAFVCPKCHGSSNFHLQGALLGCGFNWRIRIQWFIHAWQVLLWKGWHCDYCHQREANARYIGKEETYYDDYDSGEG